MTKSRTYPKSLRRAALPLVGACAALMMIATPAAADFYEGLRAFDRKSYTEAATKWRASANQGDARSQFRLGVLYEQGKGVRRDFVRAYFWYSLAGKGGNADAGLAAQLLKNKMKKGQVAQANRMVAAFKPGGRTQLATRVPPRTTPDTKTEPNRIPPNATPDTKTEANRTPPPAAGSLAETIGNTELRRTVRGYSGMRYDIWKFSPSGTVSGSMSEEQNSASITAYTKTDNDMGRWVIEGNSLCITWTKWGGGRKTCYRVVKAPGLNNWTLTNLSSGRTSQVKIAQR